MQRRFRPELLFLRSLLPGAIFGFLVWLLVSHIDSTSGAVLIGALGLTIWSSLGTLLSGLAAGVYVQIERPFEIGDRVQINGRVGTVEAFEMLRTLLRCDDGSHAYEPNLSLVTGEIIVDVPPAESPTP